MNIFDGKKILVTGAAGYIGHKLVHLLNKRAKNSEIHVADLINTEINSVGPEAARGDFRNLLEIDFDRIFVGDLGSAGFLENLLKNEYDFIFHQGAISDTTYTDQRRLIQVNVESFQVFLDWLAETNSTLIYASSAAVYGNRTGILELGNEKPINPYGYSKSLMDSLALKHVGSKKPGKVIGLRYFNVYGPGENLKYKTSSVAFQLASAILAGSAPTLFEDSESTHRDFVYIEDVLDANLLAAESGNSGVYNVGSGNAESFMEVFNHIKSLLGYSGPINWIQNYVEGYQKYTRADLQRTKEHIGFSPQFNLESGLKNYVHYLKNTDIKEH